MVPGRRGKENRQYRDAASTEKTWWRDGARWKIDRISRVQRNTPPSVPVGGVEPSSSNIDIQIYECIYIQKNGVMYAKLDRFLTWPLWAPWALVGRALMGRALMGPLGPSPAFT